MRAHGSLARSLLELEDVAETAERSHLLWHRLEVRRDAGVRTTLATQDAIDRSKKEQGPEWTGTLLQVYDSYRRPGSLVRKGIE